MTEFRLLGSLELWTAGRQLDLGPAKQRTLLAALLIDMGRPVPAETLIGRVWGSTPPAGVRNVMYTHISRIRRLLTTIGGDAGQSRLHRSPGGYLLQMEPDRVDLHRFRLLVGQARAAADRAAADLLRSALNLWRDNACADLSGEWVDQVRDRLGEERMAAVLDCADVELRLGRHATVGSELRGLVAANPLNERLVGLLMLADYRNGGQAQAIECYQQTLRRLADELGVYPGPGLQRLYQQVLRADPDLAVAAPSDGASVVAASPPPRPMPAQLPHAVDGFTGRGKELAFLHTLVPQPDGAGMVIVLIDGTPGVGKTALAVHFGHHVTASFPDGQLYADLHGHAIARPADPIEILTLFLHALGVTGEQTPLDLAEATGLYRSLLAGRRTLIVLDNVGSAEQVRPLLPGTPGCLVMITSRHRLDGLVARDGARRLTLDVMSPQEARALLTHSIGEVRAGAEPAEIDELARACAYLPLALRIAVAGLVSNPHLTITERVAELVHGNRLAALRVEGDEHTAVRAAFDVSYAALGTDAKRMFRRLGLVPCADITAAAAAAVAGTDPSEAAWLLDRLTAEHLVGRPAAHRFGCHDLLRQYAADRAAGEDSEPDRLAAVNRLYDWYLDHVDAAARRLHPEILRLPTAIARAGAPDPFDDDVAALAWLDAERANLVSAVVHAAEQGPRRMAWLLADALRGYYVLRLNTVDWLAVGGGALAAATADDEPAAEAAAHLSLGDVTTFVGRYETAIDHYSQALALAQAARWPAGQAAAASNLGNTYWQLGQLRKAASQYARGLALSKRIGWLIGEANNLANLGLVSRELGRLTQAADHFIRALELDRQTGSRYGEAVTNSNLGEVWHALGRLDLAYEHLTLALTMCGELGDRGTEADTLAILAAVHTDAGRLADALDSGQVALAMACDAGDLRLQAETFNVLGRIRLAGSRCQEAADDHLQALRLARQTGARVPEAAALIGLAAAHQSLGDLAAAVASAKEALTIARRPGYRVLVGQALTVLADIHLAARRPGQAITYAKRALAVHRDTGHRPGEARCLLVLDQAGHATGRAGAVDRGFTELGVIDADLHRG